jgi:phosphoglycolate/pyridoxal phosphate phosphatase family enzyme
MNTLSAYPGYIFDLDGTVYLGDTVLPGAAELIAAIRASGRRLAFLSNNPTRTRREYAAKLARLGLGGDPAEIVNSSYVMVEWLRAHAPQAVLFVVGEAALIGELRAAGFALSEDAQRIDYVIASFDRSFDYHKLQVSFDAIRAGARLIATNADRFCPVPGGGQPDAAAVIAAIEACTGACCELVVGKPSPIMARTISTLIGLAPQDCLMIGDRLETDIAMGAIAGMTTAFVLTGAGRREDLATAAHQPDFVLESLHALLPAR